VVALIAAPGIPAWSVIFLTGFAVLCFTFAAHFFGSFKKARVRSIIFLLLIFGAVSYFAWKQWPQRRLTKIQKEGLAQLRDSLPEGCGMLIYVPDDSPEALEYGKEIQSAFQMHGGKANLIHEGVMDTPTGVLVGVHSTFEPCGYAGEMMSVTMTQLQIPTKLREGFPRADENSIIVFVGRKPSYN
jgi:hypothetical protein